MCIAPADKRQPHPRRRALGGAITAALPPDHAGVEALDRVEIPARLVETSAAQRGHTAVERVRRDRQPALRMDGGNRLGRRAAGRQERIDEQC